MPPGVNTRYLHFQEAIKKLKSIKERYQLSEIEKNSDICYLLEHSFERVVLSFIDIANYLIAEKGWTKPQKYKDTITILVDHHIIDESDKKIFEDFVSEKNIITYKYAEINYQKLYSLLSHLDKLVECMEKILS